MYKYEGTDKKGTFKLYGDGGFKGHKGMVHDLAWAPLAGRSFHMIVSSGKDSLIVWKVAVRDPLDAPGEKLFDEPQVSKLYTYQSEMEFLRVKWNITATCFAGSADCGQVKVWQRSHKQGFSEIAALKSK